MLDHDPEAPGSPPDGGALDRLGPDLVIDALEDRFRAFNAIRKDDVEAADRILHDLGASDGLDRTILLELSAKRPLGHPERFQEAHALVMRALEVLDRNGARAVKVRRLGPLRPLASYLVGLVTRFIVRSYQSRVVDDLRLLYSRREANTLVGDPALPMLIRAREHTERLAPGFKRNPLGIPTFLLGGAVVSSLSSTLQRGIDNATNSATGLVVGTVAAFSVFGIAAWVVLRGAAVARRRIHLAIEPSLAALYQIIGRCGSPPRDQSRQFALYAILLFALSWLVVPIGLISAVT